jgi:hypothetical protein
MRAAGAGSRPPKTDNGWVPRPIIRLLSLLLLLTVLAPAPAEARRPRRRYYYTYASPPPWIAPPHFLGGFFGVGGFGTVVLDQHGGVEYLRHGGGLAIFGGLHLGRIVDLHFGFDASFHNPWSGCSGNGPYVWCDTNFLLLETVHADLKLRIPTRTRVVPYFQVGALIAWVGRQDYPADAVGGGFEIGGGLDIWLARPVSFGLHALYRGIKLGDYDTYTGSDTFLSLLNVGGDFTFHFW